MTRVIRAELIRLLRPRTAIIAAGAAIAFAVVATLATMSSATSSAVASRRGGTTLAALNGTGGATEAFAVGASFTGFLVFVTIIGLIASEFSGGTFRSLVMREPSRVRVIVGKLAGILLVAAGVVVLAELCTVVMSLVLAPSQDIVTDEWFTVASLGHAGRDFLTVMAGVAGWAVYGTMLAVIFRSAPVALGVGFAWAGPFENITVDSWRDGYRFFPGQVLGSLIQGGSAELGFARAVATTSIYAAAAACITLLLVSRRDVTS